MPDENEFKCSECGKILYSQDALQQHADAKHGKKDEQKQGPKRSMKAGYILGIVVVIVIIGVWFAMGIKTPTYTPKNELRDKFMGNESSNVTLTEFSDYECPFCARFDKDTEQQIIQSYVDTGKIKLVFKNFPLPSHANAEKAAEAAECADDIGGLDAFWQLHEIMFKNNNLLSVSNLKKYAGQIGLNTTEFDACLDSGVMRGRVTLEQKDGQNLGVTATPTFFVNDQKIEGAQPFNIFKSAIDSKL
jgi:protein-disulfide isomerase